MRAPATRRSGGTRNGNTDHSGSGPRNGKRDWSRRILIGSGSPRGRLCRANDRPARASSEAGIRLRAGDWVEVRSKEEILETLDKNGRLEEMPFMPEMLQYCGQRFQVYKSAHKTCDPIYSVAARKLTNAVHLELRCDGKAHGGCQVGCLLFWKEAWLKPVNGDSSEVSPPRAEPRRFSGKQARCTEKDILKATTRPAENGENDTSYVCQTTQLCEFTKARCRGGI